MDANKALARHLHIISSDIVLARCALQYCVLTIDTSIANGESAFFSTLRHHATSALAVHLYRIFDFNLHGGLSSSFQQVSMLLRKRSADVDVCDPHGLFAHIGIDRCCCNWCGIGYDAYKDICKSCLVGHLGWSIMALCRHNADSIRAIKEFRDKWVAHSEIPDKPIAATYATFEELLGIAEDVLFPFSLYVFQGHEFHDVIEQHKSTEFVKEMIDVMGTLEAARIAKRDNGV